MPSPSDLADIVTELEALKADLKTKAVGQEAVDRAEALLRQVEALRQKSVAKARPRGAERGRATGGRTLAKKAHPEEGAAAPALQKREYVVLALEELGRPSSPATVSTVIHKLWNAEVPPSQFASIRKGDERAWNRGRRAKPLIVPALNSFDLSARPRTVALSTWPLDKRIMGSLSDRADALRAILAASEKWRSGRDHLWRDLMLKIARDFRFAAAPRNTDVDAEKVSASAAAALKDIDTADLDERQRAAEWAQRLKHEWQMFGRPIGFEIIRGGRHG